MHNLIFREYPLNTSEANIRKEVNAYVRSHGDGYGTGNIRFYYEKEFNTYEEAEEYLYHLDGWYVGAAVKYRNYRDVKDTAEITRLRKQIKDTRERSAAFEKSHRVYDFKADFIGCRKCNSKINRTYIRGNVCPICHADLRSQSILDKLKGYQDKIDELEKRIIQEQTKQKEKAQVLWLVKFEYHS